MNDALREANRLEASADEFALLGNFAEASYRMRFANRLRRSVCGPISDVNELRRAAEAALKSAGHP
jgi:hypothetical protein